MIQITPPQNPQYWINQRALTFSENDLENVDRVAVSLVSGTVIMVYEKGVIDYAPDGNFQKWTLKGYSTRLVSPLAHNIYARLSRTEKDALIVFSIKNYNLDGSITTVVTDENGNPVLDEEGNETTTTSDPNENYWYVKIGEITETVGNSNRELTYDSGALGTKKGEAETGDWTEMFELSKTSTPWLIFVKQMFYEFTVKNPITLLGGLIFSKGVEGDEKTITDIKRSTDSDYEYVLDDLGNPAVDKEGNPIIDPTYVPVSDETIPTTQYVQDKLQGFDEKYIRKDQPDRTPFDLAVGGKTTAEVGLQIGQEFVTGLTGIGGWIDDQAHAELKSLMLREFLEVPEFRFNRVDVVSGELWNSIAFGTIESVDTAKQIVTLHLVDGERMGVHVNDICRGIFHNLEGNSELDTTDECGFMQLSGFSTSYFTPIQLLEDGKRFRYELKSGTTIHPVQGMKFAVYGNFLDTSRQASAYSTRTYTRYLSNVNTWELNPDKHIRSQFGLLEGLTVGGTTMHGYGSYQNNVYISGATINFTPEQEELLKGEAAYAAQLSDYEGVVKVDVDGYIVGSYTEMVNVVATDNDSEVKNVVTGTENVIATRFRLTTRVQAFHGHNELFASEGIKKGAFVVSIYPVGCQAQIDSGLIYIESVDTSAPQHYVEIAVNCEGNAVFNMTYTVNVIEMGESNTRFDLDNEMSSIACDDKGEALSFPEEGITAVGTLFYGNQEIFVTDFTEEVPSGIEYTASIINVEETVDDEVVVHQRVKLHITSISKEAADSNKIWIHATGKIDLEREQDHHASAAFTLNKVRMGENAVNYELRPSVNSVKISSSGSYSASNVYCYVVRADGSEYKQLTTGEISEAGLSLQWKGDSGSWSSYTAGNSVAVQSNGYSKEVGFRLYYGSILLDVEHVPIVSDGKSPVFCDLTNEMAAVAADEDGNVIGTATVSTTFTMWGGNSQRTLTSLTWTTPTGLTITGSASTGVISVTVTDDAAERSEIVITGKCSFQGKTETRSISFIVNKIKTGKDAVIYQLNPSNNAISVDAKNVPTPTAVYAYLTKTKGTSAAEHIISGMPTGYSVYYYKDESTTGTLINDVSKGVSLVDSDGKITISKNIRFELMYGNTLVDLETVPVAKDGNGILDVTYYYLLNNGGEPSENDASWVKHTTGATVPEPTANQRYLWKKTVTVYADGSSTTVIENVGVHGTNGRGISGYSEQYKITSSSSIPSANESGWGNFIQPTSDEPYLWRKKTTSYSDGTSETTVELVTVRGENGTSVKISGTFNSLAELEEKYPNGTGDMSDGFLIGGHLYVWDGDSWKDVGEIKGPQGDPGKKAWIHTKYAKEDGNGSAVSTNVGTKYLSFTGGNGEDVGDYEGIYSDWTETDSTNIYDYTWRYIRGEMGLSPNTAYKSTVFKWAQGDSVAAPGTGTTEGATTFGGSYSNPVPYGWSDGVPARSSSMDATYRLWGATRIFSSDGKDPQQSAWSTPKVMADSADFDVEFSSVENPNPPSGHPNTNTSQWSQTATENTIWMATSTCTDGAWSAWSVSKIKGERGDDGTSIKVNGSYETLDAFKAVWWDTANGKWKAPDDASECYVVAGDLYVWDGDDWVNVGQFKGDPGVSQYLHIKYSNSLTVGDWTDNEGETPGKYIGTYVNEDDEGPAATDENWSLFKWTKWVGDDGFGYEYIYKLTTAYEAPAVPTQGSISDSEWQKDDYVPSGWTDDPQDVSEDYPYAWICYRRKTDGKWGAYIGSATNNAYASIWARYSKDGESNIRVDLDNEMQGVACDANKNVVASTLPSTNIYMYYGSNAVTITKITPTAPSGVEVTVGGLNTSTGTLSVTSISQSAPSTINIPINVSGTYNGTLYEGKATLTINKIMPGADGKPAVVLDLVPSANVIKKDMTGNYITTSLSCKVKRTTGSVVDTPSSLPEGYTMSYIIDSVDEISYTYGQSFSFPTVSVSIDVVFFLKYNGTVVDKETIPVVSDGKKGEDGLGSYTIDLTNENTSVPCDYYGNVVSAAIEGTQAKVYYGGVLQTGWTFSAAFSGCSGSCNSSTGVVTISALSEDSASVSISASKTNMSTLTAVYTLSKVRAGSPGDDAVVYLVRPQTDVVQVYTDNTMSHATITCAKYKQVGAGSPVETEEGYLVYKRSSDTAEQFYSGAVSLASSMNYVDFILYNDSTKSVVYDRERVPVVKDGKKGDGGDNGVVIYFTPESASVSVSNSGNPTPNKIVVSCRKRVGVADPVDCADYYLTVWRSDGSSYGVVNVSAQKRSSVTVTIDEGTTYKSYEVIATKEAQTTSTYPSESSKVLSCLISIAEPGGQGNPGENGYFPRDRGMWSSGQTYYYRKEGDDIYRDKVLYAVDGKYYNFLVAARNDDGGVTTAPTLSGGAEAGNSDGNWEVMSVYRALIADTFFAENANIGGFMTTDQTMISQGETDGEPNIYMNGETGEFRCINAYVKGQVDATSGTFNDVDIKSGTIGGYTITETDMSVSGSVQGAYLSSTLTTTFNKTGIHTSSSGDCYAAVDLGLQYGFISPDVPGYSVMTVSNKGIYGGAAMCGILMNLGSNDYGIIINGGSTHILSSGLTRIQGLSLYGIHVASGTLGSNVDFIKATGNITLPTAAALPGKMVFVKMKGNYTISSSSTIYKSSGSDTYTSESFNNRALFFISDGSGWYEFTCYTR